MNDNVQPVSDLFNNEKVLAQARSDPKVSGGAIVSWAIAGFIMLVGIIGAVAIGDNDMSGGIALLILCLFLALIPGIIGLVMQMSFINSVKSTVLIATEGRIYCRSKNVQNKFDKNALMEVPYESIMDIRVAKEGIDRKSGDSVILKLMYSHLDFRYITNASEVVMAIHGLRSGAALWYSDGLRRSTHACIRLWSRPLSAKSAELSSAALWSARLRSAALRTTSIWSTALRTASIWSTTLWTTALRTACLWLAPLQCAACSSTACGTSDAPLRSGTCSGKACGSCCGHRKGYCGVY